MRFMQFLIFGLLVSHLALADGNMIGPSGRDGQSQDVNGELARAMRTINVLEQRILALEAAQKDTSEKTGASLVAIDARLRPVESKLTKITEGWFLIRSSMSGSRNTYILDVRDGRADGLSVLQLAGDDAATPQPNRKFRLQLLDH